MKKIITSAILIAALPASVLTSCNSGEPGPVYKIETPDIKEPDFDGMIRGHASGRYAQPGADKHHEQRGHDAMSGQKCSEPLCTGRHVACPGSPPLRAVAAGNSD